MVSRIAGLVVLAGLMASPAGASAGISEQPMPHTPVTIAYGPDGNLWRSYHATGFNAVAKVSPAMAVLDTYSDPYMREEGRIVTGPDGWLWMAGFRRVHRISTSGELQWVGVNDGTTGAPPGPEDFSNDPSDLVAGSDGHIWVNAWSAGYLQTFVARIEPPGHIVSQPAWNRGRIVAMAAGRRGITWFSAGREVWGVTGTDQVAAHYCPAGESGAIIPSLAVAPDGDLWFPMERTHLDMGAPRSDGSSLVHITAGTPSGTGCPEGPAGPQGAGGHPPGPGADTRAPVAAVLGRAALRRGTARVRLRCDEPCRLTVRGRLRRGRHHLRAPKAVRASLRAGVPRTLRIAFPRRAAARLRARHLRLSVAAADAAGNRRVVIRTVRLRRV